MYIDFGAVRRLNLADSLQDPYAPTTGTGTTGTGNTSTMEKIKEHVPGKCRTVSDTEVSLYVLGTASWPVSVVLLKESYLNIQFKELINGVLF